MKVQRIGVSHKLRAPTLRIARRVATTMEPRSDIALGSTRIALGSTREEEISPERRRQMIAEAAYFRAERRGFAPGAESEDWLESEAEIEELLAAR